MNRTVFVDEEVLYDVQKTQRQLTSRLISMMCMHSVHAANINGQPLDINVTMTLLFGHHCEDMAMLPILLFLASLSIPDA